MKVYGGCIEPEGRELENHILAHDCKMCGGRGYSRHWEEAEGGSINYYFRTWCDDCDHEDGNGDDGNEGDGFECGPMTEEEYAEIYAELDEISEEQAGEVINESAALLSHQPQTFGQRLIHIARKLWH